MLRRILQALGHAGRGVQWLGVAVVGGATVFALMQACAQRSDGSAGAVAGPVDSRHVTGVEVTDDLMAQWQRQHPGRDWVEEEVKTHSIVSPADNTDLIGDPQGQAYGRVTALDVQTWKRETLKLVAEGSKIFHSADLLQSSIAVSCDMCHPDAANTHPETYPKFQVQLGRVALLRDMINWCVQQAVRGQPFAADSPQMRALEAYIYAQRKGTPLDYGRR